jgi:formylglycine-generating enzyme
LNENERKAKRLTNDWIYTLPTEAQWEYACRAGSKTAYSWGDSIVSKNANSNNSQLNQTGVCGQYEPNKWGFYDMHGNVLEWCLDWYDSSYGLGDFFLFGEDDPTGPQKGIERVCKGGSWYDKGHNLRSASRQSRNPIARLGYLGFRLALKRIDNAEVE